MRSKILIIEDDEIVRENTAELLELAGYEVETAVNGKFGVEAAKSTQPDVIICDIMMPELDGYGVLYLLSKDVQTASIPFIFLTAKTERADMRKGMELGADDYLMKPFEESELLNAIEIRLKKAALLQKDFTNSTSGIEDFFNEVRSIPELENLSHKQDVVAYKKEESIFKEGGLPRDVFFIASGKVKLLMQNNEGQNIVTQMYTKGDFFGYLPILKNERYKEDAIAFDDAEIYAIPKEDFLDLMHKNKQVCSKFLKLMSNNIEELEARLLHLAYDSVRKRTADALLTLCKKYKQDNQALRINISRKELAEIAGTATESLIRALADFKQEKMIEVDKKSKDIVILDEAALTNIRW